MLEQQISTRTVKELLIKAMGFMSLDQQREFAEYLTQHPEL
jgi:hypothetical protein